MTRSSLRAVLCAAVIGLGATLVLADGMEPASEPPMANADAAEPALPSEVVGVIWQWVSFITPKEQIDVDDPSRYTLELAADGHAALQVDCNRGMSQYTLGADNRISFSPIGVTMMMCEDDQLGHRFTTELERVGTWFQQDGDFFLELPMDSGTFRFQQAP